MDRYKQKGNDITFDGHTMFKEDILRDLNVMHRKLEDERYIKADVIETAKREARVDFAIDLLKYPLPENVVNGLQSVILNESKGNNQ